MSAVMSVTSLGECLEQGWSALLREDLAQAMTQAQAAAAQAPDAPEVAHLLGMLATRDGRPDLALPLLQKALDGGVTARRLRDMGEALLTSGHAQAALAPVQDCLRQFGASHEILGLLAAIQAALKNFDAAAAAARSAIALKPELMAWESTLGFCELIQGRWLAGFRALTGRAENRPAGSRCPVLQFGVPGELWLKNEQGPGDTLFHLRYAPFLALRGCRLHIQTDRKTKSLLRNTGLFASVKEELRIPHDACWLNMGDLPLAALQTGAPDVPPPLPLTVDPVRQEKMRARLAAVGPAPYVAVSWRAGPRGRKQRNGIRMFSKQVEAEALGHALAATGATIISVQRLPDAGEAAAFRAGLGRGFADFSLLNDKLEDMLALLSLVDDYIAVPNTNVHLRASLGRGAKILLNAQMQDWRWPAGGDASPWYPDMRIFRQTDTGDWRPALETLQAELGERLPQAAMMGDDVAVNERALVAGNGAGSLAGEQKSVLRAGWEALGRPDIPAAIRAAQQVLQAAPENAEALRLLGWAALRDLKTDLAISVLERAFQLDPQDGQVVGDYVRAMTAARRTDQAIALATHALDAPGLRNATSVHYGRAAAYLQLNRIADAVADYEACMRLYPNRLDAPEYYGMALLKLGRVREGFRHYTARKVARRAELLNDWCCPRLTAVHSGARVLIKRDMGLGDELTYLRYLPWLVQAGIEVDYWAGRKLVPLLERTACLHRVWPDSAPPPAAEAYDLSFIVNDLPLAVELLGAPEVAPPLALAPRADLVEKWKAWLGELGSGPYIGFNWRAGVTAEGDARIFAKLAKAVDAPAFARALAPVGATWISLQRNVTHEELLAFEQTLGAPVHDAAALSDDLEDMLALLSLLDENVGVSNTNMHLRASLGLGSRVLVQMPGGDWRWGYEGSTTQWFSESQVYRQTLDGEWSYALQSLRDDLLAAHGAREVTRALSVSATVDSAGQGDVASRRLIWLTAGHIRSDAGARTSDMASTRYRVLAPAAELDQHGWQSEFVVESTSQAMGGWGSSVPRPGDTFIISKVFTDHALKLARDAKARGARVVADFCDNFLDHPKRGPLQHALLALADRVVVSTEALAEAIRQHGGRIDTVISDPVEMPRGDIRFAPGKTLELLWFGHAVNLDTLANFLPGLAHYAVRQPLHLNVVTTLPNGQADLDKITPPGLAVTYTPWSVAAMQQALAGCDMAVIPVLASQFKAAKSPNRLLEPLWAGRFVVAGPLPAYRPFGDSAWVGENLVEGIAWALEHPEEVRERIARGQADIEKYFTASAVAQLWQQVLNSAVEGREPARAADMAGECKPVSWSGVDVALLFSESWYRSQAGERFAKAADALVHCNEAITGPDAIDPNPWVDAAWYRRQHPGLATAAEAIDHFLHAEANQPLQPSPLFDPREAGRLLGKKTWKPAEMLAHYLWRYPANQLEAQKISKVAVFTAIFGGYDDPPRVENPDPAIDYILFTDHCEGEPPAPWQVRRLPRVFDDPQVDARRVKLLSHLFLPDYDAAVWMDGNVTALEVSAENVRRMLAHAPIALCRHQFRACIYDEAAQILKTAKDATAPVLRQVRHYQSAGFPRGYGLHATMFLVRNHRDVAVHKFNARWWDILAGHSKRDQLGFDFVRWEQGASVLSLPLNCRENTLFLWGSKQDKGHKGQVRRNDESLQRAFSPVSGDLPTHPYTAAHERWHGPFLLQLQQHNAMLQKHAIVSERGNPLYLAGERYFHHALPDPRLGAQREVFLAAAGESMHMAELGFDTGHAALLALNHSGAKYTALTTMPTPAQHEIAAALTQASGGRFRLAALDEAALATDADTSPLQGCDTLYLNGALPHAEFTRYLQLALRYAEPGARLVVTGIASDGVRALLDAMQAKGYLQPWRDLQGEGAVILYCPLDRGARPSGQTLAQLLAV